MGIPHLNILTKCDKIQDKELLDKFTSQMSATELMQDNSEKQFFTDKFYKLNKALCEVIDGFSLVNYHTLDITDEESVSDVLMQIDNMVQFDDFRMPNDKRFIDEKEPEEMEDETY